MSEAAEGGRRREVGREGGVLLLGGARLGGARLREEVGEATREAAERARRLGRDREDVGGARARRDRLLLGGGSGRSEGRERRHRRRFLEHHVHVRASDAKRREPRVARPTVRGRRPGRGRAVGASDEEGAAGEIDLWVEYVKVARGHERAPREAERRLDEPRDARGGVGVRDVALDRADGAVAHLLRAARARGVRLSERAQLDAVADERARRVALDVGHLVRGEAGGLERRRHRGRLPRHAGRRVARLARAVVGDAAAADDGEHAVVVGDALTQPLEYDGADGVAEDGAVRVLVKGAHLAVDRVDETLLEEVARARKGEGGAARDGHVRLPRHERGARLRDGGEGRRARRVDGERGAHQVESVRDARGDVIFLGAHLGEEDVARRERVHERLALEVVDEVAVDARRGEDGRLGGRARARRVARVLERRPRDLHEHAVLRAHDARLDGRDAPEARVEELRAVDEVGGGHEVGVEAYVGGDALGAQLGGRPQPQRVLARAEQLPELLDVVGAREGACVAHEREVDAAGLRGEGGGGGERVGQQRRGGARRRCLLGREEGGEHALRRALEEVEDGDRLAAELLGEAAVERGDQLGGEQRVAAQIEEGVVRVVRARLEAERLGPDGRDQGLKALGGRQLRREAAAAEAHGHRRRTAELGRPLGARGLEVRLGKLLAVELLGLALAHRGRVEKHPVRGQRVRRELLLGEVAHRVQPHALVGGRRRARRRVGQQVRDECARLVGRLVEQRHDGAAAHARQRAERRLEVRQADLEAADLDRRVGTPEDLQRTARQHAREVARPVDERRVVVGAVGVAHVDHAAARALGGGGEVEGLGGAGVERGEVTRGRVTVELREAAEGGRQRLEALGGELGGAEIRCEEHRRGDVQLAREAARKRLERLRVEHGAAHAAERRADGGAFGGRRRRRQLCRRGRREPKGSGNGSE